MNKPQLNYLRYLRNRATAARKRYFRMIRDNKQRIVNIVVVSATTTSLICGISSYSNLLNDYHVLQMSEQVKADRIAYLQTDLEETNIELDAAAKELKTYKALVDNRPEYFTPNNWYVSSAEAPRIFYAIPLSEELQCYTYTMCCYFQIPEMYTYLLAIFWQETHYTDDQIHENENGTTDYGIAQINSSNIEMLTDQIGITDIMDPEQNICSACYIFAALLTYYDGNIHKSIMAYNLGTGNVAKLEAQGIYSSEYTDLVYDKLERLKADQYE